MASHKPSRRSALLALGLSGARLLLREMRAAFQRACIGRPSMGVIATVTLLPVAGLSIGDTNARLHGS